MKTKIWFNVRLLDAAPKASPPFESGSFQVSFRLKLDGSGIASSPQTLPTKPPKSPKGRPLLSTGEFPGDSLRQGARLPTASAPAGQRRAAPQRGGSLWYLIFQAAQGTRLQKGPVPFLIKTARGDWPAKNC